MADVKSTQATNLTATPKVREPSHRDGGMLRESASTAAPAAAQADTDFIFFCRVPSKARVSQVLLSALDFTTAGAIDVGVYTYSEATGLFTAVDDDLFASAFDLSGGPFTNVDITNESTEYSVAEQEKALWEVLGLSSDPNIDYWIGSDITTTFNGGSPICLKVRYVL